MKKMNISTKKYPNTFALIDDDDYYKTIVYGKWYYQKCGTNYYVMATNKKKRYLLHRIITGASKNQMVDHKNHDTLDNRKCNLRFCTNQQNQFNSLKQVNNTSGYKGVYSHKKAYQASMTYNNKSFYIGRFKTKELAAMAYNKFALEIHGEFACLNKIPGTIYE